MFWHYLATALCVITNVELSIGHLLHVGLPLPRCPGAGRPFQHATANATANENHEFLSFFKFLHFIRLRKRLRHVVTCCDIASLLNPQCFRVQARHLESSSARVLGRAKCTGNVSENASYASCDRNLTHWITWKPKKYIPLTTTYIWPVLTEIIPLADCKLRLASSTSSLVFWKSWRKNNQKGVGLQHFEEHYHGRMISLFFPHLTIKPKLLKQSKWLTCPPPWAWHWGWCGSEHQWCVNAFLQEAAGSLGCDEPNLKAQVTLQSCVVLALQPWPHFAGCRIPVVLLVSSWDHHAQFTMHWLGQVCASTRLAARFAKKPWSKSSLHRQGWHQQDMWCLQILPLPRLMSYHIIPSSWK